MNTIQATTQSASWNKFLKLTEEARVRNTNLAAARQPVSKVNKEERPDITQLINEKKAMFNKTVSFNQAVPRGEMKILGRLFDTYV
ncbi:MAG: hypothetical protein GX639_02665 [Fibrobacter sp.]|nr:hypothetical protein [Fibrobacter sp.]